MGRSKLTLVLLGLSVGFAAGFLLGRETAPPGADLSRTFGLGLEGRPLRGPEDAPVTIIEFTDYECPFCQRYSQTIYPKLFAQYGGRINYAVRHFPATYQHRRAHKAAQAAECAGDQGEFFAYHELLFKRTPRLDEESLIRYAAMLGLEPDRFGGCLRSGAKSDIVDDDLQAGIARGVAGTPSFLINGRMLVGFQPLSEFQRYIERDLQD
ncbi:MAG: DsbA family protein [Gemmatimonadetes bacterium]|nr:DsbA family protein [Gemmatimonadota bacterium]NIR99528.1 DsbA family protein [Gemmatimonadota bacterium]NIV23681.1 thioredoxin domain-containing protein [Gemmatimonadota bacterium]NIW75553.1 thioredoxin domain-containing protein [Gemmatimonadota bacterium]